MRKCYCDLDTRMLSFATDITSRERGRERKRKGARELEGGGERRGGERGERERERRGEEGREKKVRLREGPSLTFACVYHTNMCG